jgi:tetratricopeptide (TPR) repeat protein
MGRLRLSQRQFSEAESWYRQALSHDANSVDALQGLLNSYVAQKQLDKAIAATNTQIALSPKNSVFYDLLGSLLMQKNDFAAAEAPLKKSIELNKNNSDAYMKLGQSELRRGLVDNALATYKRGSEANPKEAGFLIAVGSVYETKHDLDSAKKAYQTALQMRPRDPIASNNLAYVLLETNANPDMALQLAQDARRSLPGNSNVADTLGWAFYQKGIYSSAVTMFEEAIKLAAKNKEPENATYHYHLGLAYAKSEKPVLARQHFERVLKLDPKYSGADDIRKQLAQLKS